MTTDRCPQCGSRARLSSSESVCPACLLEFGIPTGQSAATPTNATGTSLNPSHILRGVTIGDYEILEEIGRGGMGIVYKARQRRLNRIVALKTLRSGAASSPAEAARFRQEATIAAKLQHEGIVRIHEIGDESGQPYFSMDWVDGMSLAEQIAEQPMPPRRAAECVRKLARAIEFAHSHGVLHRDLKPSNILIGADGLPRVSDFGLAKWIQSESDPEQATLSGTVLGSPGYMSPEQARGRTSEVSAQSDVYSLGAVLYELLTGRPPFRASSPVETMRLVIEQDPQPITAYNPGLPRDLDTITLKCLSKNPFDRYASSADMADELDRFLDGRPVLARPLSPASRLVRWSLRHPALASSLAGIAVLLVLVTVVSTTAAGRLRSERNRADAEAKRAGTAEARARAELRGALVAQAKASRYIGRVGQRMDASAAALKAQEIQPGIDALNELVAASALPDAQRVAGQRLPLSFRRVAFDPDRKRLLLAVEEKGEHFLHLHIPGNDPASVRIRTSGGEVRGFPQISPTGHWIASRFGDGTVRVWKTSGLKAGIHAASPTCVLTNRPYPDVPTSTRFGEDLVFDEAGERIAVGDPAGGISWHRVDDGRELGRWKDSRVPQLARFSPTAALLAVGAFRGSEGIAIVDTQTGSTVSQWPTISGARAFAWSPDGQRLAVSRGGRIEVIVVANGSLLRRLETPEGSPFDLRFDPTGNWLFSHSGRSVYRWWSLLDGRAALEYVEPTHLAAQVAVSSDFRTVLTMNEQGEPVTINFEPSPVYKAVPADAIQSMAVASSIGTLDFSPDDRWISVACLGEIQIRERITGRLAGQIKREPPSDWLTARFGRDSKTIYFSSRGSGLHRCRMEPQADGSWKTGSIEVLDPTADFMLCSIHRPSETLVLASARKHQAFRILAASDPAKRTDWPAGRAYEATFNPDGTLLVSNSGPSGASSETNHVEIRETSSGRLIRKLDAALGATARWSRNGALVITASHPDRVQLWNTKDWSPGPTLDIELQNPDGTFAISPDAKWLAVFNGKDAYLSSAKTGRIVSRLGEPPGTVGYVTDMQFSHDGRTLALLRRNGLLCLWDLRELNELILAGGGATE